MAGRTSRRGRARGRLAAGVVLLPSTMAARVGCRAGAGGFRRRHGRYGAGREVRRGHWRQDPSRCTHLF
eukprot:3280164-Pyramimonas_sp.AAC.1